MKAYQYTKKNKIIFIDIGDILKISIWTYAAVVSEIPVFKFIFRDGFSQN